MKIRDIWFFKQQQNRFLGIDIGTASVKIVELSKDQERGKLENYAIYDAAKALGIKDSSIQTSSLKMLDSEVAKIVLGLIKEAKFQTKRAVFAIPVFSTFTTLIELPFMPKEEIDRAIKFEAKQYIPIPLNEVVYDWDFVGMDKFKKIPEAPSGKLEKAKIILVAVPKEVINKYISIAKLAKLDLAGLELETFSLVRSVLGNDSAPACLVDTGSRNTNIAIVDKGTLVSNHNIDTSGIDFTKVISNGLGVDLVRADEIKKSEGLKNYFSNNISAVDRSTSFKGEKEIANLLHPIVDVIVLEIERLISIYSKKSSRVVDKIILAGGSANLPGLIEYISKKFNKTVLVGNPWSRIIYPSDLDKILKMRASSFAVAVGAAMRNL